MPVQPPASWPASAPPAGPARPVPPRPPSSPPPAPQGFAPPSSLAQPLGVPRYGAPPSPPPRLAPERAGSFNPQPAPPPRERRALWVAIGVLVALALVGAGFGLSKGIESRDDNPSTTLPSTTAGTAAPSASPSTTTAPATTAPAAIASNADEPAAAVAPVVGPSVVRIKSTIGEGSGIVYDKNGVIFTNAHVIEGAATFEVTFANGRKEQGVTVTAKDVARDIAILKVAARDDLVPIVFGRSEDVRVGQIAIAIGAPFGLDQSVTQGIVSALGRNIPSFGNCGIDMIQTDAPINPGNSGGALVDKQARLIGMNTSIRTTGTTANGNVGIGFAVPSNTVKASVDKMLKGESTDVALLGIGQAQVETNSNGVLVGSVVANSPAAAAGLREGDLILSVNGEKITNFTRITSLVQAAKPGDVFDIAFSRDGAQQSVKATLTISPACRS